MMPDLPDDRPLPSSIDDRLLNEKPLQKLKRRLMEEPLIPLGCLATCYAFWRSYKSLKARDSIQLNKMFRARIYGQTFTIFAMLGGSLYYSAERKQEKELQRALDDKKAQEKRDAWLRELETRDREDQEWQQRHAAIDKAAKEAESKDPARAKGKIAGGETKKVSSEISKAASVVEDGTGDDKHEKRGVLEAVKALVWGEK